MSNPQFRLETLPPAVRRAVDDLIARTRQLAGERLLGVTFFGPFAPDWVAGPPRPLRSVMVFGAIDLDDLRSLAEHGPGFAELRIAAPLAMTPEYIQASLDSFSLELLEIQQQRATPFGHDYFADLAFDETHVRLQCERELKTILIGMHQGVLTAAHDPPALATFEWHVAATLLRILAGLIWLKGKREPLAAERIVTEVEVLAGRPLGGIRQVLLAGGQPSWSQFKALYENVDALRRLVDGW